MFENLQKYYEYLEQDSELLFDIDFSEKVLKLRDSIEDDILKKYCSYELFFTDFTINNGHLKPKCTLANGQTYPNFDLFDDGMAYIKSRAEEIKNPKYYAKYNQLLWDSKYKHLDYVKKAIDGYFDFLKTVSFSVDDNIACHIFETYYKNLFILSQSINYKKKDILEFLNSLIGVKKINGYKENSLMYFVLEEGKKNETSIFQDFFNYSNSVVEDLVYPDFVKEYLQLLIVLSKKLNISPKPFHNKLAGLFVNDADARKNSFIAHDFYLKALNHYHKAGNKEKIEEVTVLIERAKINLGLKTVKIEHTDQKLQDYWNMFIKFTDELIEKGEGRDIYQYIMSSDMIFPKAEKLNEDIRPVMFDFITVTTFDINKNISGEQKSGINSYNIHILNFSINHLWMVFSKGIKSGKISYESLMEYLQNHSWYGQDFTVMNSEGKVDGFNWIELLSPSLSSFFHQLESDMNLNTFSNQGYILSTDSLVIKFEGLFREFSRKIGAQTIEIKDGATKERISFEKLLDNEKLTALIPSDDIAFFKYLFTSDGMDLRNNIAHCFYKTNDYSPAKYLLLIAALLKLGNYKFKPKE